jgi:hypothetical protein
MSLLPFLELFFFSFRADGLSPRFSVRFNGRSLLEPFAKRSVRQKRSPGEIEIIDGAAFEDISWVAAITRNIDSN